MYPSQAAPFPNPKERDNEVTQSAYPDKQFKKKFQNWKVGPSFGNDLKIPYFGVGPWRNGSSSHFHAEYLSDLKETGTEYSQVDEILSKKVF
jgi:hypothetical protein